MPKCEELEEYERGNNIDINDAACSAAGHAGDLDRILEQDDSLIGDGIDIIYFNENLKTIFIEKPYKNGKINGTVKIYYESGLIRESCDIINGVMHGNNIIYHYNGQVSMNREFANGKLNGYFNYYKFDGQLKSSYSFLDDKAHGECVDINNDNEYHYSYYIFEEDATKEEWERHELIIQLAHL